MAEKISKKMALGEAVQKFPATVPIMMKYGLHCVGCHVAAFETIEQGAAVHGMPEKDLEKMLSEMNEAAEKSSEAG